MRNRSPLRNPASRFLLTIVARTAVLFAFLATGSASAYTHHTLHSFCAWTNCGDGSSPNGLLEDASGDLYGTAVYDGKYNNGVVFKLIPNADGSSYSEHVIHNFCRNANCTDGSEPYGDLIMDVYGNLYGTTVFGGHSGSGVIFEITPQTSGWKYTVLHSFCSGNCPDGSAPTTGLSYAGQASGALWNRASPLFGTTYMGGAGNGVVYEITTSPYWLYQVIHKFQTSGGPQPVLIDAGGNVFGVAQNGGKYSGGVLYKLTDGAWTEVTLHNFCAEANCSDGAGPLGRLLMDSAGNLFGTTVYGGSHCGGGNGCGVVFERPSGGGYRVLYNFCSLTNCSDGAHPRAGLIESSGNLFGTTYAGGANSQMGVVFRLTPGGAQSVLYKFCPQGQPCTNGAQPDRSLLLDDVGDLFGTTESGGANGDFGTVFELKF